MPGFGSGPFGSAPFGEYYWSERTFWLDIPETDRVRDEKAESFLRYFADTIKPQFDGYREAVRDVFDCMNPLAARTRFTDRREVHVVSQEVGDGYVTLEIDAADADLLIGAGRGWVVESQDLDFKTWFVERVYKQLDHPSYSTPTTPQVIVKADHAIFAEASLPLAVYLRPQSIIPFLGKNYGLDVDEYEPDEFQRSSVFNHDQWYMLKGHQSAYEVLGKISGFDITVHHLFRLRCGMEARIPALDRFEIPAGSGKWYTFIEPYRPVFDEVGADAISVLMGVKPIPTDLLCFETEWTPDIVPFGATMIASVGFTDPYQGWEMVIQGDLNSVCWPGGWYVRDSNNVEYFIEEVPEEILPGQWRVRVSKAYVRTDGHAEISLSNPALGACELDYSCHVWRSCCFCGTHKIRIVVDYLSYVTLDPRERVSIVDRLIRKIYQVVPAHVVLAQLALRVPMEASFDLRAHIHTGGIQTLVAGFRYLYDVVDADVVETDMALLTATITF